MAITFFGSARSASDGVSNGVTSPNDIAPPASMVAGDLVVVYFFDKTNASTIAISADGGQTWTAETANSPTGSRTGRLFWCRFNGTWSANPSWSYSGGGTSAGVMLVFRPTSGSNTWAVDVAISNTNWAVSPQTVTGITCAANSVAVIGVGSTDDNEWTLNGGSWVATAIEMDELTGTDCSAAATYQLMPSGGATGNVTATQTAVGPDNAVGSIISFVESAASGDVTATPGTVAAVASVPAPTTQAAASSTPSTVAGVGAVPGPTVSAAAVATPATVAVVASVPTPTLPPINTQGLVGWFKADAITGLVDTDPVATWTDSSPAANNATQGTSTKRPAYRTAVQNGLPIVRFDGTDDLLALASRITDTVVSVFAVLNKSTVGSGYDTVFRPDRFQLLARMATAGDQWGVWESVEVLSGATIGSTFRQVSVVQRAAADVDLVTDGTLVNRTNGTALPGAPTNGNYIGDVDPTPTQQFQGDLGELIIYNRALGTSERAAVESYLATKWGLTAANATATPATVAVAAAVPAPTVQAAAQTAPSSVVAVAAVPAPTVQAAARPTPGTVAATGAVPAPAVLAAARATPGTVTGISAVPAPTVRGTAITTPSTVTAIGSVPAPSVLVGGNATAAPNTVAVVSAVPAPALLAAARTSPAMVAAVAGVGAPTIRAGAITTPNTVAALTSVPTPTIPGAVVVAITEGDPSPATLLLEGDAGSTGRDARAGVLVGVEGG